MTVTSVSTNGTGSVAVPPPLLNIAVIDEYLDVIAVADCEIYVWMLFYEDSSEPIMGPQFGNWSGRRTNRAGLITELQTKAREVEEGSFPPFTLHICPQIMKVMLEHEGPEKEEDTGKKKTKIVQASRVLLVDLDKGTTVSQLLELRRRYQPHLIVESSEGKYHFYWKVVRMPLEEWKKRMMALTYGLNGDWALLRPWSHPIRVPGVRRLLKDGGGYGVPEIVRRDASAVELRTDEVDALFPEMGWWIEEGEKEFASKAGVGGGSTAWTPPMQGEHLNGAAHVDGEDIVGQAAATRAALFVYDYAHPSIARSRFSELAVAERVLQRFGKYMIKIENMHYAFDEVTHTWQEQSKDNCPLYARFVMVVCLKLDLDERFIAELGLTSEGAASVSKQESAKKKFRSGAFQTAIQKLLLNSADVRQIDRELMDSRRGMLCFANGLLDLSSGVLREVQPEDYVLNRSGVDWDSKATYPRFKQFLLDVFEGNQLLIDFMQEIGGYSLSGFISEQKIFVHEGLGANGKSLLLAALRKVAGAHETTIMGGELMSRPRSFSSAGSINLDRLGAKVQGKRLATINDTSDKTEWNDDHLKQLTSGILRAANVFKPSQQIPNRCKIHVCVNVVPKAETESHGLARRLCIIPYRRTFKEDAGKHAELELMIEEEAPGIARFFVEGYQKWARRGRLEVPVEITDMLSEYAQENFPIKTILEQLFEAPDRKKLQMFDEGLLKTDPDIHFLDDLLMCMNQGSISMTSKKLAAHLKALFNVKPKRIYDKKRQNTFGAVLIKRKNTEGMG